MADHPLTKGERAAWIATNNTPEKMLERGSRLLPGWQGVGNQAIRLNRGEVEYLEQLVASRTAQEQVA